MELSICQLECCEGLNNLDYSKIDTSVMADIQKYIDLTDVDFCAAVLAIIFNPLFWNIAARGEHKTRFLTRLCQSPYYGCYFLGTLIILLNIYRSYCFTAAMNNQAKMDVLDCVTFYYVGMSILVTGTVFVVCSLYALGFVGTFLGDYFGILMDKKVTGFPFNIMDNPMYWGSTLNHLGWALINASPAGLILTAVVALTYKVAIMFEGPFTEEIYQQKEKLEKNK